MEQFNDRQLALIADRARTIAELYRRDELGVAVLVQLSHCGLLTEEQLRVVSFCAHECRRQESGALSVYNMVAAYNCALSLGDELAVDDLRELGMLIEPEKNAHGFRYTPVRFATADATIVVAADNIESQLRSLMRHGDELSGLELYVEFEEVHPFDDGNGRLGAILFNKRNGTLGTPQMPPLIDFAARRDNRCAPVETFIINR